ncbi:MAG: zinc ribbon domain-containing protein [Caldilineaceae bacterium]|nr:zinc ribbon domain-containing protein [Caldilineaceae bacterium]
MRKNLIPWGQIQGAVWLVGLAIIAWQNWWWPGILVLVALSGIVEGIIRNYTTHDAESKALEQQRVTSLPEQCPSCGSPVDAQNVRWINQTTANCPYCGTKLTQPQKSVSA